MRVLLQRVKSASVSVNQKEIGAIQSGLVLYVGFTHRDTIKEVNEAISKILKLRIFDDEYGKMNLNIQSHQAILSISQFTLYGDAKGQNRPSFIHSMPFEEAKQLYLKFNELLRPHIHLECGEFGAHMNILQEVDGPVTMMLEF
jgi:D-aminoacyl-tRNA deacylase